MCYRNMAPLFFGLGGGVLVGNNTQSTRLIVSSITGWCEWTARCMNEQLKNEERPEARRRLRGSIIAMGKADMTIALRNDCL